MGDLNVGRSDPYAIRTQQQETLDQVANSMRGPEGERFEKTNQLFQELTPSEAKELYNKLKANNDPISKEFNAKFRTVKDQLFQTLKSNFDPKSIPSDAQQSVHKTNANEVSSKKADIHLAGQTQQNRIQNEFAKNQIKLDPQEKQIMEKSLLGLSDKEFKQLIDDLPNREKTSRDLLLSTLHDSKKLMDRFNSFSDFENRLKIFTKLFEEKNASEAGKP